MADHVERHRILLLILIMVVMGLTIGGLTLAILYQTAMEQAGQRLMDSASGQARLIEAMARHDMTHLAGDDQAARQRQLMEGTLKQLREAKAQFPGQGKTGEFLLGHLQGDQIIFLLHRRHDLSEEPIPIPFNSPLAEPMRRAVTGRTGIVIGPDYRGVEVLAAHEPLRFLEAGVVAKIDMEELRAPFLHAAGVAFGVGVLVTLAGVFLFFRVSEPLLRQIQETALLREHRQRLEEARQELQERTLYLDNILRTAIDMAIVATDAGYCIKYCNPTAERLHGLEPGSALGRSVFDLHHERGVDPQRFEQGMAQVQRQGEHRYEVRDIRPGHERILASRVCGILDAEGNLVGYVLMARDVTAERLAQEALTRSERKYRLLVESANDALIVADADTGVIIEANPMAETLLRRPLSEIIGLHQTTIHPPEEANHYARLFQEHVQGQRDSVTDIEVMRATGERVPVEIRAAVTDLGDRRVILGIFRDVTERKRQENALRASQESLARAQSIAHLGNWDWDMTTDQLNWSDEVYRIFGLTPQSFCPSYEALLLAVHSDDRLQVGRAVEHTLTPPYPPYDIEHRIIRPDGVQVFVHERGELLFDDAGRPGRMIGTIQDITARKNLETRLQELNQELESRVALRTQELSRSNRDLQQFAYVASHDLQEPLRLVAGFVQLLEKRYSGVLDEKATQYIAYVVDGVKHMDALINSLLAYARVETQGEPLVALDSEQALTRALRFVQRAMTEAQALVTHDPLPVVLADEGQLAQVFQNLLANAIKFRGDAPPVIHVSCRKAEGEWLFSVRDNGIGIDAQYAERIFIIFQKLHARSRYEGTGIGLALCKRIVERHGGRMWVESTLGSGSAFFFTLPAREL